MGKGRDRAMRVAIMGTGGVGGYFGGRLAAAGHDVWFIARGEHLEAILRNGLQVDSPVGDFRIFPAQASADPASVGAVDVAIVSVKTWQLPEAAATMAPLIGNETTLLPLLNGVEAAQELAEVFGRSRVLGGLCRIIAYVKAPGQITHAGVEPTVVFGELDDRRSDRVESLRDAFDEAGVRAEIPADLQAAIWTKFMLISTWSGIGAVTRVPVGEWRSVAGTRALAEASLQETLAVAQARGVRLSDDLAADTLTYLDGVPAEGTASMQRDIAEGKPSELASMSGTVLRLGSEAGVPTPTHRFLYYSLLPQETAARRWAARAHPS